MFKNKATGEVVSLFQSFFGVYVLPLNGELKWFTTENEKAPSHYKHYFEKI